MAYAPPWGPSARRWACVTRQPLTLRAWLAAPLAWDPYNGVPCEGALQYAVVQLASGMSPEEAFADAPRDTPHNTLVPIPIPIVDQEMVGMPVALASWAQPAPGAIETTRIRRKRARAESYGLAKVNVAMAEFKSEQIPVPTLTAMWVEFHVVGDRDRLHELLPHVTHIGRGRSSGLGHLLGWEILEDYTGRSILDRGRLMRSVPSGSGVQARPGTFTVRHATTRAPYWHRASLTECMVPIARVVG